jgi:hypothetical protein
MLFNNCKFYIIDPFASIISRIGTAFGVSRRTLLASILSKMLPCLQVPVCPSWFSGAQIVDKFIKCLPVVQVDVLLESDGLFGTYGYTGVSSEAIIIAFRYHSSLVLCSTVLFRLTIYCGQGDVFCGKLDSRLGVLDDELSWSTFALRC